jgi:RNA polymerase sigma factor (TIGR02999 family)
MDPTPDISALVRRVHAGEPGAQDALFAGAYDELRRLARARLRDGGRGTLLDTTALVHESYLRCLRGSELRAADRSAFFAFASQVMRSVIVDTVRERLALRRGGDLERCTLDTAVGDQLPTAEGDVLHVHEALQQLAATEPRLTQVVEMRYFGGYSEQEIADALNLTERTVRRDWEKARALLLAMLGP